MSQEGSIPALMPRAGAGFQFRFPFLGQVLPVNLYWTKALSKQPGDQPEAFSFTVGYSF